MNSEQKRLWIKELYEFNKKTDEEISIMLDIDISEVRSYIYDRSKKIPKRDIVKKLYLEDNKSYEEISEELGLSINTVKMYVSRGGYSKNPRPKRKSKSSNNKEKTENEVEKPYVDLGDGYVIYEGKLMKKMTKEEFVIAMIKDQKRRRLNN